MHQGLTQDKPCSPIHASINEHVPGNRQNYLVYQDFKGDYQ